MKVFPAMSGVGNELCTPGHIHLESICTCTSVIVPVYVYIYIKQYNEQMHTCTCVHV